MPILLPSPRCRCLSVSGSNSTPTYLPVCRTIIYIFYYRCVFGLYTRSLPLPLPLAYAHTSQVVVYRFIHEATIEEKVRTGRTLARKFLLVCMNDS